MYVCMYIPIQSYSYHPPPRGATKSEMWTQQEAWMERYGYGTSASGGYDVLGQFHVDTYLFHYADADIMRRKPWALGAYQVSTGVISSAIIYSLQSMSSPSHNYCLLCILLVLACFVYMYV